MRSVFVPKAGRGSSSGDLLGKSFKIASNNQAPGAAGGLLRYFTYSMTTRRLGSTPVEWVEMFSMSCSAAWITWRS